MPKYNDILSSSSVLLVSNQLDYSGAPMALLSLARELRGLGINISLASIEPDAGLWVEFEAVGVRLINLEEMSYHDFDLFIYNTIVTTRLIRRAVRGSRSVLWIHESPYLGGLLWSRGVEMQNTEFVDEIWFPSNACKREWSVFLQLEKTKTLITPSPVVISASCKTEPKLKSKNKIHIVLFDSPERYRRLAIVEEALEHTGRNLHVDFVGTSKPVSIYTPAPSVSVTYHGRVSHNEAMKILERSDIYMSAALMATQNRAMCEAMCMRKGLLVTSIPAHLEYIQKARYERALTFSPLERLNLSELVEGVQRLPVFEQTPRLDIFSRQRFRSFVKARLKGPSLNT